MRPVRQGKLFVLSGPSGVGKDTVLAALKSVAPDLDVCVTATTRSMRPTESPGNPYEFLSMTEFERMVEADEFLEWARVNGGNLYGTPRAWVSDRREAGRDVLLKIDVQGGIAVRSKVADAVLIFLEPPSFPELERRLRARSTETEDAIRIRLLDARSELNQRPFYDYAVVNDTIEPRGRAALGDPARRALPHPQVARTGADAIASSVARRAIRVTRRPSWADGIPLVSAPAKRLSRHAAYIP